MGCRDRRSVTMNATNPDPAGGEAGQDGGGRPPERGSLDEGERQSRQEHHGDRRTRQVDVWLRLHVARLRDPRQGDDEDEYRDRQVQEESPPRDGIDEQAARERPDRRADPGERRPETDRPSALRRVDDAVRIARLLGTRSAPPSPAPPARGRGAAEVGAIPHSSEPVAKTTRPSRSARRRPKMSPNEPPSRMNAVASTRTRRRPRRRTRARPGVRCSVGRATFTTVESRKLIDDARMVASSTQRPSRDPIRNGPAGGVATGRG